MASNCTDLSNPQCTCPNYSLSLRLNELSCGSSCDFTIFCVCKNTERYGLFTEFESKYQDTFWQQGIYIASIVGYSLFLLIIHRNKSLQVHPMNLIYYITIVDTLLLFNVWASFKVCKWKLPWLLTNTVFFDSSL